MRLLTTRLHALLDYLFAGVLVALPWVVGFADGGPAQWMPVGAGAALLVYSLLTDYELGALRRLQVPVHLWLDTVLGLALAASPWVFAFDERVWVPHLAAGVVLLLAALVSDTIPGYERRRGARTTAA
jgi:hypothetical protein